MHYWLVMPAAGAGRRFGGPYPKQHAMLASSTVVEVSLRIFLADDRCRGIALPMAADDPRREALSSRLPVRVRIIDGGAQRSASVLCGLEALGGMAAADDWVLVHDAVRPALSIADLDRLLAAGAASTQGALLASPVTDTLKQQDGEVRSIHTVARDGLWRALTPQMFRFSRLQQALRQARARSLEPTDEAQAIEWLGDRPLLVAAADSNLKVTTAEDLVLAAAILASRQ